MFWNIQPLVTAFQVEGSSRPFSDFLFLVSGLGVPICKVLLPEEKPKGRNLFFILQELTNYAYSCCRSVQIISFINKLIEKS